MDLEDLVVAIQKQPPPQQQPSRGFKMDLEDLVVAIQKQPPPPRQPQPQPLNTLRTIPGVTPPSVANPVVTLLGKMNLERVLNLCEEYESNGVTLYVKKPIQPRISNDKLEVFMICPLCEVLESFKTIGPHMSRRHQIPQIECAGLFCEGIFETEKYQRHIETKHFYVLCPACHTHFFISDYILHINHSDAHVLNSEKLRPKVLRSTSAVSATPSLSLTPKENPYPTPPQPTNPDTRTAPELTLGPATFTPAVSRNAKILLKGAVLLMDGLSFAVKENIAFMDCPLCRKPLALTILGDHLKSEHELKRLTCGATGCAQILESRDIMKHLYSKHGHLSCPDCGYNLYIHEVRDHIRSQCSRNFADSKRMPNPLNLTSVICSAPKLRPHEQKICPHCFMNVPDLKGHLLAEHDPKIKCDYCGKKVGRSVFQAHLNLDHGGSRLKRKKCPICLKLFGKLKVHLRAHHDMSKEDADSVYVSETKGGVLEVIVKRLSDPSYLELYNVKVVSGGDERPEDEDQSNSGSQFSPNSASLAESEDPSTEDEYEPMINDDDEEWNPNM